MDGAIQVDLTGRDVAYARRKFNAHKGWKTRIVNAITRSSNLLSQSYHWDTLQTLKKDVFSLNKHMDALRFIAQWMEDEGHDEDHAYMNTMDKIEEEVAKVIGVSNEVIHASRPAPVPVIAAQAAPQGAHGPVAADFAMKIAGTLKPEKLRASDTPQQFRAWEERMQAYFQTGGLDKIGMGAQQAVVRALIDSDLDQTVKHKIDATVPIFRDGQNQDGDDESVMKLLEEQILIRHPLAVRRRDFLKHALKPGQSVAQWRTQHRQLGNEAALERLSTEDLYCLTYVSTLSGVPDLGDKLLDCVEPDLLKYEALIDAYVQKLGMKAGLADSSSPAAAAAVRENRKDSKAERERKKGCYERKICYVCGSPGHMAKTCRTDRKCKCSKCNGTGHTEKACVKPTGGAKARSVENKEERTQKESEEQINRPERETEQLALEYDQEQPRRLLVVRCSARTARGSMPTPPIQL